MAREFYLKNPTPPGAAQATSLGSTVGCDRNRMPLLSKASNVVQNIFFLYDVTGFTQIGHSIPVATNCNTCIAYHVLRAT